MLLSPGKKSGDIVLISITNKSIALWKPGLRRSGLIVRCACVELVFLSRLKKISHSKSWDDQVKNRRPYKLPAYGGFFRHFMNGSTAGTHLLFTFSFQNFLINAAAFMITGLKKGCLKDDKMCGTRALKAIVAHCDACFIKLFFKN